MRIISGEIPANIKIGSLGSNISGEIPTKCSKQDKIQRIGSNKRKNSLYLYENMGIFRFNRNFSVYFSNTVKSTFSNN
jgi:hypothetical protein